MAFDCISLHTVLQEREFSLPKTLKKEIFSLNIGEIFWSIQRRRKRKNSTMKMTVVLCSTSDTTKSQNGMNMHISAQG